MFKTSENDSDFEARQPSQISSKNFRTLVLGSLGVVYGDIGTSPLYAFREAAHYAVHDGVLKPEDIYGLLSLIIWSLIVIVTLKYVLVLLRVDNRGEGGILSLMMMARRAAGAWGNAAFLAGLIGAGLFFGDAAITPAISVLSAVEGLETVSSSFDDFILPIALVIIVALFLGQSHGTAVVAKFFGPVMVVWFLILASTGIYKIIEHPEIFRSLSPYYGVLFLYHHSTVALAILGSVFLAVTGAEALYADLGHFGRKPIEYAWLRIVFPCLILNYLGQGASVLAHGEMISNPFFSLVPKFLLIPFVIVSAMATVIASQAVITGAYSMARQAIQMGLLPHLQVQHTSANQMGQIYMPQINKWLMYAVIILVVSFGSSSALAAAYGISVTGTMVVSTVLAFFVLWKTRRIPFVMAAVFLCTFLLVEGLFFWANVIKVFQGGFISLLIAGFVSMCMLVWLRGTRFLHKRAHRHSVPLMDLMEQIEREPLHVVGGTAVFMTSDPALAPLPMQQNIKHNKVIHSRNIVMTVITSQFPRVPESQRVVLERVSSCLDRIYLHYGFMESPNVPQALAMARLQGLDLDLKSVSYFVGHRTIVGHPKRGLPIWQEKIYIAMARMAVSATDYYHLPSGRVVEVGIRMNI